MTAINENSNSYVVSETLKELIKTKYFKKLKNANNEWPEEWPLLMNIIPLIHQKISFKYEITDNCLGVGGNGIVLIVNCSVPEFLS